MNAAWTRCKEEVELNTEVEWTSRRCGRLALAAVGGALVMWVLAGLWHTLLVARFYETAAHAQHEGIGVILLGYLTLGGLMAYLQSRMTRGGRPLVEGLRLGVVVGLLWVLPHGLVMVGAHGELVGYVLKNAVWHLLEQGVGGLVVAYIWARDSAEAPLELPSQAEGGSRE